MCGFAKRELWLKLASVKCGYRDSHSDHDQINLFVVTWLIKLTSGNQKTGLFSSVPTMVHLFTKYILKHNSMKHCSKLAKVSLNFNLYYYLLNVLIYIRFQGNDRIMHLCLAI